MYYKDRRAGCFQELVVVPEHTVCPTPQSPNPTAASCLGVGGLTAAMALWRWLELPMHPAPEKTEAQRCVLVWGGSTITGQFAIQMASHAGMDVIAVRSDQTAALVRDLGPTHVVTYSGKSHS